MIASSVDPEIRPQPFKPVLRGARNTGGVARYLRADISGGGGDDSTISTEPLWWPPNKPCRYLAPYLSRQVDDAADVMPQDGLGFVLRPPSATPRPTSCTQSANSLTWARPLIGTRTAATNSRGHGGGHQGSMGSSLECFSIADDASSASAHWAGRSRCGLDGRPELLDGVRVMHCKTPRSGRGLKRGPK